MFQVFKYIWMIQNYRWVIFRTRSDEFMTRPEPTREKISNFYRPVLFQIKPIWNNKNSNSKILPMAQTLSWYGYNIWLNQESIEDDTNIIYSFILFLFDGAGAEEANKVQPQSTLFYTPMPEKKQVTLMPPREQTTSKRTRRERRQLHQQLQQLVKFDNSTVPHADQNLWSVPAATGTTTSTVPEQRRVDTAGRPHRTTLTFRRRGCGTRLRPRPSRPRPRIERSPHWPSPCWEKSCSNIVSRWTFPIPASNPERSRQGWRSDRSRRSTCTEKKCQPTMGASSTRDAGTDHWPPDAIISTLP